MNQINRKRVLIVDDEPTVRRVVRKMLAKDYIVLEAEDGVEAVNVVRREKPDVVLMDVVMPKMDGVGACHLIKSASDTSVVPVIMLSARVQELDQEYVKDVGADGYIVKPFGSQELTEAINRLLPNSRILGGNDDPERTSTVFP